MALTQLDETLRRKFADAVPHVKQLGICVDEISAQSVRMSLPFREEWLGDPERGVIHTGVVTTLVDSASGLCVLLKLASLEPIATLDLRMDYLRPALRDKTVYCRAECYRVTPHIAFVRANVWQDDEDQPVATSQSVFMRTQRNKPRGPMIPSA